MVARGVCGRLLARDNGTFLRTPGFNALALHRTPASSTSKASPSSPSKDDNLVQRKRNGTGEVVFRVTLLGSVVNETTRRHRQHRSRRRCLRAAAAAEPAVVSATSHIAKYYVNSVRTKASDSRICPVQTEMRTFDFSYLVRVCTLFGPLPLSRYLTRCVSEMSRVH
ncbi:hypothetical protein MRX96_004995 [Rhipicephalus microplus]